MEDNWTPDPQIVEVVDAKMVDIKKAIIDQMNDPDKTDGDPKYAYFGDSYTEAGTMLRLDWELMEYNGKSDEEIVDLLFEQLAIDFYDILEHGDASNYTDPFLGGLNGKRKVGRDLVDIKVGDIMVYKEYHQRKDSFEYTIYTRLGAIWS